MVAGGPMMVRSESKSATTEFAPPPPGLLESNGAGQTGANNAQADDLDHEVAWRGVVAIQIPREVIARFSGTLIVSERPERQLEIVFDHGRQFRDLEDE
jgi:hypothetical protein